MSNTPVNSRNSEVSIIGGGNTFIMKRKSDLSKYVWDNFALVFMKNHQIVNPKSQTGTCMGLWGKANEEFFAVIF